MSSANPTRVHTWGFGHLWLFLLLFNLKVRDLSLFAVDLEFLVEEYASNKGKFPPRRRRKKKSLYVATIEKVTIWRCYGLISWNTEPETIFIPFCSSTLYITLPYKHTLWNRCSHVYCHKVVFQLANFIARIDIFCVNWKVFSFVTVESL